MERSSKGLFDFLCSQMEKLDKKTISIEHLKAQAAASKQLNNVLMYELNRAKFVQKFPTATIREVDGNS